MARPPAILPSSIACAASRQADEWARSSSDCTDDRGTACGRSGGSVFGIRYSVCGGESAGAGALAEFVSEVEAPRHGNTRKRDATKTSDDKDKGAITPALRRAADLIAVAQWRSGAVAQWRSGAVAQWRSGAVALTHCNAQSAFLSTALLTLVFLFLIDGLGGCSQPSCNCYSITRRECQVAFKMRRRSIRRRRRCLFYRGVSRQPVTCF